MLARSQSLKPSDRKLLERLQALGALTEAQGQAVTERVEHSHEQMARVLVDMGFVDEKLVARQVARLAGVDFLDLDTLVLDGAVLGQLEADVCRRYRMVPVGVVNDALVVALADVSDVLLLDEIKALIGRPMRTVLATASALQRALTLYYPDPSAPAEKEAEKPSARGSSSSVVPLRKPAQEAHRNGSPAAPGFSSVATVPDVTELDLPPPLALEARQPSLPIPPEPKRTMHDLETRFEESGSHTPTAPRTPPPVRPSMLSAHAINEMATLNDPGSLQTRITDAPHEAEHSAEGALVILPEGPTEDMEARAFLSEVLSAAVAVEAEEVEFNPPVGRTVVPRGRKGADWLTLTPYPARYHEALLAQLQGLSLASGSTGAQEGPERHFHLETRNGTLAAVLSLTTTMRGGRALVRLPENVPLLQNPLRVLGLEAEDQERILERLNGAGGGLLFITATHPRLSAQLYSSLLHDRVGAGRSVVTLEWGADRTLPGVSQIPCADAAATRRALRQMRSEKPDLLGISAIPSAQILRETLEYTVAGNSVIGCFTAADSAAARAVYVAAGLDRMQIQRGVVAHVHAAQAPRLCGRCRQAMDQAPKRLPQWAQAIADKRLYEARGCEACEVTGRRGTSWVTEVLIPTPTGESPFETLRSREKSLQQLALDAWLDPRDVR